MVTLDIVKLDYNQQLEDDQFKLEIPDGTSIQHLK
jgi:outer membrane lipoprotein-sorting protein